MTYRSIFVHVDDTEPCACRLDYAARVAKRYPGELLGGYIVPPSDVTAYSKAAIPPDMFDRYVPSSPSFAATRRRASVPPPNARASKGSSGGRRR